MLRWFWWRVNAWTELAAMLAGFVIGLSTSVVPLLQIDDFGLRISVTAALSAIVWIVVMWLTPPEDETTLNAFYRRVRPGGPGWERQRLATGLPPAHPLGLDLARSAAGLALLFGAMFAVGGALLLRPGVALANTALAVVGWLCLRRLRVAGETKYWRAGEPTDH